MNTPKEDLISFLKDKGFAEAATLPLDGQFHRFSRNNGSLNGYFKGRLVVLPQGTAVIAVVGDWKTKEQFIFEGLPAALDEAALKGLKAEIEAMRKAEKEERERLQEEVARHCEQIWANAIDRGLTPYLERKGLKSLHGAKIDPEHPDTLLVPARDVAGKLWGIQRILPQKLESGLDKLFTKGMKISGCFHLIGEIAEKGTIYVSEGFATGASIHEATGAPVACAFNAGNLVAACEGLAHRYPSARIVVCGDDDRWTIDPKTGLPWNPGKDAARSAAQAVVGGEFRLPRFADYSTRPTDFNDLAQLEGLLAVRDQIMSPPPPAKVVRAGCGDLLPLEWGASKRGTPIPPDPQQVADALIEYYGDKLIRQEDDFFLYTGTHWKILGDAERAVILQQLQWLYSERATAGQLEGFFTLFKLRVRSAPVDMFDPRPTFVNYLNGTLVLTRDASYRWHKEFRPHRPEDYLLNVIPLRYDPERRAANRPFLDMLERVFQGDPDKDQKVRAVRQMYGACLAPFKPHLFLLHGPAGSGKSSLIICAQRLVHKDNWCSIQPHEFKGFLMESMVGKLVNFRTDVKTTEPIDDDTIKMIEDQNPVRIDRKFRTAVYAPLPAIHIFGANGIPPTQDGASGAHARRWTFIKMTAHKTEMGKYMHDFGNWVFDQSPEGVNNFALEGLDDLLENGHFLNPESGSTDLVEWQLNSDPVGAFIDEIRSGNSPDTNSRIILDPRARITPAKLWEAFKSFALDNYNAPTRMQKRRFYHRVEQLGFPRVKSGVLHFAGIGVLEGPDGQF